VSGGRGPALLASLALLALAPAAFAASSDDLVRQLKTRGIRDQRVLEAMARVRREAFAPERARGRAYDDGPLDIGHGQTMSQPYMVALMTEQVGLKGDERVLEIGTGSGYHAAVLATLAHDVYTVEIVPELATGARLTLTREGYRNVHVKQGDGTLGWREYGPYDAIIVTAVAPSVPRALIDQLREGGVLVMPLGDPNGRQVLVRGVKRGAKLRTREVAEVRFVPLLRGGPGAAPAPPPRRPPDAAEPDGGRSPGASRGDQVEDERPSRRPGGDRLEDEQPPRQPEHDQLEDERAPRDLHERAPRDFNEEELRERDDSSPESDRRLLPAERIRAARVQRARDSDRRCAAGAAAPVAADSRRAGWRSAA